MDLDRGVVVGLLLKPDYCSTILAMVDRAYVEVRPVVIGNLTGNGGDGGGYSAAFSMGAILVDFKQPFASTSVSGKEIKDSRESLARLYAIQAA